MNENYSEYGDFQCDTIGGFPTNKKVYMNCIYCEQHEDCKNIEIVPTLTSKWYCTRLQSCGYKPKISHYRRACHEFKPKKKLNCSE